jgi:hypothetical protein
MKGQKLQFQILQGRTGGVTEPVRVEDDRVENENSKRKKCTDSPGPLRGHTSRLRSFWGGCWDEPVAVPAQWEEGSKCVFLMASTRGRLLVLGGNPLHGSDALDSRMGACLWDLSLGQHIGDGKLDGETFLGRTWMLFSGGGGGGETGLQDACC